MQQQQQQQHYGTIFILKRSLVEAACFDLVEPTYTFGSSPSCDIRINLPEVKEEHCRITKNSLSQPTLEVLAAGLYIDGIEKAIGDSLLLLCDTTFKIVERSFRFECAPSNTIENESQNNNNKEEVLLPIPVTPKKARSSHLQSLIDSELTASPRVVKSLLSIKEDNVKEEEQEEENENSAVLEIENIDSVVPVDLSIDADANNEILPEVSGADGHDFKTERAEVAEQDEANKAEQEEKVANVEMDQQEKEIQEQFVDEKEKVQKLEDSIKEEYINEVSQLVAEETAIEVKDQTIFVEPVIVEPVIVEEAIVEEMNKEMNKEIKEEVNKEVKEEIKDVLNQEVKEEEEDSNEKVAKETNNEVAVVEEILKEEEKLQEQLQEQHEEEQQEQHEEEQQEQHEEEQQEQQEHKKLQEEQQEQQQEQQEQEQQEQQEQEQEEKEEQRTPKIRRTSSRKSASTSHYKPEQKLLQQKNRRQTLSPKKSPLIKRGKGIVSGDNDRNDGLGNGGNASATPHRIPECLQEVEPNSSSSKANNSKQ